MRFHIPKNLREWMYALGVAWLTGGIGAIYEYFVNVQAHDLLNGNAWPQVFKSFLIGAAGGVVMYLKEPAKMQPKDPEASPDKP